MRRTSLFASFLTVAVISLLGGLPPSREAAAIPTLVSATLDLAPTAPPLICALPISRGSDPGVSSPAGASSEGRPPSEACLASAICAVKRHLHTRGPLWTEPFCDDIAHSILTSSARYGLPPLLLLAIMINESTMDENAVRLTLRNGTVYAKDGGLMGLRCVLGKQGRCRNGHVRGLTWSQVVEPANNIAIAARELAYWRDVGGVAARTVKVRDQEGVLHAKTRFVRCSHEDHAFWAHYNHGMRFIDHGPASTYPLRVATLYQALSRTLQLDDGHAAHPGLGHAASSHAMRDGQMGLRERTLCRLITDVGPVCAASATAQVRGSD